MSSYAGLNLFGSGPHAFRPGSWQRSVQARAFAGVHGQMLLDLGLRFRTIVQTGRLQADSAEALHALLDAVHAACNLQAATLVDNHGRSYPRVVLERIEAVTPLRRGRGFYCDYQAEYRQLP